MEEAIRLSQEIEGDAEREGIAKRLDELIRMSLEEDLPDVTAPAIFGTGDDSVVVHGRVMAKEAGVLCGSCAISRTFAAVDPRVRVLLRARDGTAVCAGDVVADVVGPAASVLAGERTALNFVQRMSGVATKSAQFADAVACSSSGGTCRVLDTRKTLPGWRVLDKYATRVGGVVNHRHSLADMAMVKDNHATAAGSIDAAVARVRAANPQVPVEVEVRDMSELAQALAVRPPLDRIMLDNMSEALLREAVAVRDASGAPRVPLEASGGVNMRTISGIAATGVEFVSVGATTHSAPALDLNMKVEVVPGGMPKTPAELWVLADARRQQLLARIRAARAAAGASCVVLAHHYARDDAVAVADCVGDSLQLARAAVERKDARFVVWCGVAFMAETSAVLAAPGQRVLMPVPGAGCSLADCANAADVARAWDVIDAALAGQADSQVVPVVYVNSSAALKAFVGRHGGAVCTSSNVRRVLEWALSCRRRVFVFPDRHLASNTAAAMGVDTASVLRWSPFAPPPSPEAIRSARIIAWAGACNVHQRFRAQDVADVRKAIPGVRVVVHPECDREVVAAADEAGSTSRIIDVIASAPAGTSFAVGTEQHLVARLAAKYRAEGKTIVPLSSATRSTYCQSMAATTLPALERLLDLVSRVITGAAPEAELTKFTITVDPKVAEEARTALDRMFKL